MVVRASTLCLALRSDVDCYKYKQLLHNLVPAVLIVMTLPFFQARPAQGFIAHASRQLRMFQIRTRARSTSATSTSSKTSQYVDGRDSKEATTASAAELPGNVPPCRPSFRVFYNDVYEVILPPNHRFPMEKYRKVRLEIQRRMASLSDGEQSLVECDFIKSPLATDDELTTTHAPNYVLRFLTGDQTAAELRNVGLPWSHQGVDRALSSTGGTVAAAREVCDALRRSKVREKNEEGGSGVVAPPPPPPPCWAAHVAGGTHHAFADRGEGFCVFSDIAVAANVARREYPDVVERILIIDCDVHQGNGNSVLFNGRNDVMTFSLHCSANYFSPKEDSDLDVELPPGCTDETYLLTLSHWLKRIRCEGGKYDLIFFQAGVDVLDDDRLGRMSLSREGVRRRNCLVYQFASDLGVPLVITMGGGYPREDWAPIIEAHADVYFDAHQYLAQNLNSVVSNT